MSNSTSEYQDAELYCQNDLNDLYEQLESFFPSQRDKGSSGEKLFDKYVKSTLFQTLCVEWGYCDKKQEYDDQVEFVIVISDMVASAIANVKFDFDYPPVILISAILAKIGLNKFCQCSKEG